MERHRTLILLAASALIVLSCADGLAKQVSGSGSRTVNADVYGGLAGTCKALGSSKATIVVTSVQNVDTDLTVPSTLAVRVGKNGCIIIARRKTMTINGPFQAGLTRVFGGDGSVSLGKGSVEYVYAQWWGARGDGASNDTGAIRSAMEASSGNRLRFPAGTYLVRGDSLEARKRLVMTGDPGSALRLMISQGSVAMLRAGPGCDHLLLEGITFDVNQTVGQTWTNIAVLITGPGNARFARCRFVNSSCSRFGEANRGYGIYLAGAWGPVDVEGCFFERIMYGVITEPRSGGRDLAVKGSLFRELSGDGVEINVPHGSARDILVDGNTFRDIGSNSPGRGFGVGASGAAGSTVESLRIRNNSFYNVEYNGVHIEDGVKDCIIEGNLFSGCGESKVVRYGAAIYVAAAVAPNRGIDTVTISGNRILGNERTRYGIYVGGSYPGRSLTISGNRVEGIMRANSIFVGSAWEQMEARENTVIN
jgi:hypothetical protein